VNVFPVQELTLYVDGYFVNQWDATCCVALDEKKLPFSTARGLLRDGQGVPAALRELTSIGRVPALQHGDVWLTESSAIAEYLEEVFPPPDYPRVFPAEPRKRARVRQIMSWLRADLRLLREERPWWMTVYGGTPRPLSAAGEREAAELVAVAAKLIAAGELAEWSIASADLAFTLLRLHDAIPAPVRAFVDEAIARPSLRAYLDHPRPPHPPPVTDSRG
jgi:glutathione S-transferase